MTQETLERKTAEWLRKVESVNTHRMRLERERSALLVIDMQKFFLDQVLSPSSRPSGTASIFIPISIFW